MKWTERIAPVGLALTMAFLAPRAGQAQAAAELSAKVLPSVVSLTIQRADGKAASGAGFLTLRDGLLATAWHLVGQARSVTARFANGEEFECSGVVDMDAKRNVALVRIKTFGRPFLGLDPQEPGPGAPVAAAAVRDGAFGLISASAGEAVVIDGLRLIPLSGDLSGASGGGPVVNERGEAFGLLASLEIEGRPEFFAVPAAYLLGLDHSLSTRPWSAAAAPAAGPAAGLMTVDEVDTRIGQALMALAEDETCLAWASVVTRGHGFLAGAPDAVYQLQQGLDTATAALSEIRTDDELRRRVGRAVLQMLSTQKAASESFIRSVVVGQQAKTWGPQSQDAQKRSLSLRQAVASQIGDLKADLAALAEGSAAFREHLPAAQRYYLGLADRPSGYQLGVIAYPRNPFFLLVVSSGSLAHKIGLRAGDKIVSVADRSFTVKDDLEELKLMIKSNLGRTLPAVVERNGKAQDIRLKIPKEIPKDALYAP